MGCAASQPSESETVPLDGLKPAAQPQAPSTIKAPKNEPAQGFVATALPAAAVEPRHEAPVPAQVAESQAAAIAEASSQKKAAASTSPPSGSRKSPTSSRTTVVRPPWGATPSAAAALRRKEAQKGRLPSPSALKLSSTKPGSGGSTPRAAYASPPVALGDLGSAGAAALSSRRRVKAQEGTGSDGSNTPRYLQATATAAAKMSKTPKGGPMSADKRQPWGMRKPSPTKRTLAFPGGASLNSEPTADSVITSTQEAPPPTVVLSSVDGPLIQNGDVQESPTKKVTLGKTLSQLLGGSKVGEAELVVTEAEPALEEADTAQPAANETPSVSPTANDSTSAEAVDSEDEGAEPLAAVEKVPEPQMDVPVAVAPPSDTEPVSEDSLAVESSEPAPEVPAPEVPAPEVPAAPLAA